MLPRISVCARALRRVAGPLAFGALFISAIAGSPTAAGPPETATIGGGRDAASSSLPAQSVEFDQLFIDMMVPHHEGAVEMAKIAQQRAQRPEILAMAVDIISSQEAEIGQMRDWRLAWYGSAETPPMSEMPMLHDAPSGAGAHAMDMAAEVEALRGAPDPFERAFIDAMIPHHQGAIDAARLAQQRAVRQEIKDLARAIIADQQREIDQMQQWFAAWYGAAPAQTPASPHDMQH